MCLRRFYRSEGLGNDHEAGRRKVPAEEKNFLDLPRSHGHEAHRVRVAEILIAVFPQDRFRLFLDVLDGVDLIDSGAGLQSFEKTQSPRVPIKWDVAMADVTAPAQLS